MAQVNDIVRFLNQMGGGRITRIEGNMAYVEDEDGFEQPALLRECVVVESSKPKPTAYDKPIAPLPSKEVIIESPKPVPVVETDEGDVLNIVLAYEPREIKHLNTTTYDAYLVNDSNYYLYFVYMPTELVPSTMPEFSQDTTSPLFSAAMPPVVEPETAPVLMQFRTRPRLRQTMPPVAPVPVTEPDWVQPVTSP